MRPEASDDKYHHIEYLHFMIDQLQGMIRYIDSKHALGITLVASLLFASNEFIFPKILGIGGTTEIVYRVAIFSAICAIFFGFMGIFPRLIPPFAVRSRHRGAPNILYFQEIYGTDIDTVRKVIDETFPNSGLSLAYRESGLHEIYALSQIVMVKLRMFEWFMFTLLVYLTATIWLLLFAPKAG